MNWTQDALDIHYARLAKEAGIAPSIAPKKRQPRGMNSWEREYAHILECQRLAGVIQWWAFEPMKLRLATGAYYKPDFGLLTNGVLSFVEIKGMWREAARVRIKVAAEHFPFIFIALTKRRVKDGGDWSCEEFRGGSGITETCCECQMAYESEDGA